MKKLIILVSLVTLIFASYASVSKVSAIDDKDDLIVGTSCPFVPFEWQQSNNANGAVKLYGSTKYVNGYDIKFAKQIASKLNKNLVIKNMPFDQLLVALQNKDIEVIIAGMTPTETRKEYVNFADDYFRDDCVIVVKSNSKYRNAKKLADFKGARIGSCLSSSFYSPISQMNGVKKLKVKTWEKLRLDLLAGKIDGYIASKTEYMPVTKYNKDFKAISFAAGKGFNLEPEDTDFAMAINKDDEDLLNGVNGVLKDIALKERNEMLVDSISNSPHHKKPVISLKITKSKDKVTVKATSKDSFLNANGHTFDKNGQFTFYATNDSFYVIKKTVTVKDIKTKPKVVISNN